MSMIQTLLAEGRFAEAIAGADAAMAAAPWDTRLAGLPRMLGDTLFAVGLWEDAAPWLARAAWIEPWDSDLAERAARARLPSWLAPDRDDPGLGRPLKRYAPRESGAYTYVVEVVGTCNLRCPTCPVGNSPARPKGFMSPALFADILAKIRAETPDPNPRLALYNWGEPLLHPQLPRLITMAREQGLEVELSTNLNIRRGLEAVVAAAPAEIKVSLSGFTPETYGRTHARGDLALVTRNLRELRRLIDRHGAQTRVWIGHHLYKSNRHQVGDVARLALELGFEHQPMDAFFMPLERLGAWLDGDEGADPGGIIPDLPLDPKTRQEALRRQRNGQHDCELRFAQTVINHDGGLALCCGVYDAPNMLGAKFLDLPHAEIEARRYAHPFCAECMAKDMHYAPPSLTTAG
jgi:pyruvate-formate lyase-activating enzyme